MRVWMLVWCWGGGVAHVLSEYHLIKHWSYRSLTSEHSGAREADMVWLTFWRVVGSYRYRYGYSGIVISRCAGGSRMLGSGAAGASFPRSRVV